MITIQKLALCNVLCVVAGCSGPEAPPPASREGTTEVVNGYLFLEGDINLGPVSELEGPALRPQSAGGFDRSRGFEGAAEPWPSYTIPFRFDGSVSLAKRRAFQQGVDHYRQRTVLRWVEVDSSFNGDLVLVKGDDTSDGGCWSYLGHTGLSEQELQIGRPSCTFGSIIHEMGHAAGLIHEHQRPDRNAYVIVGESGANWDRHDPDDVVAFGDYDIQSLMHYCTSQGDITDKQGNDISCNRTELTAQDIIGLHVMYGSELEPPLAVESWSANRLDAFVRGDSGAVHHVYWNGSGWVGPEPLGGFVVGSVDAVSWGPNRLDLFARGESSALFHKSWNGSSWASWQPLGGSFASHVRAVSWGPNRIDVFGKGSTGSILHKAWTGSGWDPPTGMQDLGGFTVGPVEAVSWGPDRIDVFAVGESLGLYHKAWTGSDWTSWQPLGGSVIGRPSVVSWGPNRLDIFIKGQNNTIWHKAWKGDAWSPSQTGWTEMPVAIVGNPTAVAWGPNRLDVFAQGVDGNMIHRSGNGTDWSEWDDLGGTLVGSPVAVAWGSNRLDILARGRNDALYNKAWTGSTWAPSRTTWNFRGGELSW